MSCAAAGYNAGLGVPYTIGMSAAAYHIAWQIRTVDLDSRADCLAKFISNQYYGALVLGGIVADKLLC